MQTFLPYADFAKSASVLDRARLGKQRVETLQLLQALLPGSTSSWKNHPAAKMWRGFEPALSSYGLAICAEWTSRGYKDTCREKIRGLVLPGEDMPSWLGREDFHRSHQSNLSRKNREHYCKFWPDVEDNLPYIWPTNAEEK